MWCRDVEVFKYPESPEPDGLAVWLSGLKRRDAATDFRGGVGSNPRHDHGTKFIPHISVVVVSPWHYNYVH